MTSVELIRNVIREDGKQDRKDRRDNCLDKNRGALGEVAEDLRTISSPEEIQELAGRLKHKGHLTLKELKMLQHAFIQSEDNISAFLRVNGSLHALVRDLSGSNTQLQLAAANCCCNLSLGNPKFCLQITKFAAPYLISSLDGLNNALLDTCVWTLGNLAGSDIKCWMILKSQGVLQKLAHLLTSFSDDIRRSAIYALSHFIKTGFDNLEANELEIVANLVHSLMEKEPSVYWLVYLLSCSPECCAIFIRNSLLSCVINLLHSHLTDNCEVEALKTTALLRILANLCASQSGLKELVEIHEKYPDHVRITLGVLLKSPYPHIQKETLWLLGNLVQGNAEMQQISAILSEIHHELNESIVKITSQQM